ncbi:hypothetical protein LXL04_038721 [Taraxacum kok-saghyz]
MVWENLDEEDTENVQGKRQRIPNLSIHMVELGSSDTPLWRNGPLEKPVLCNACGSRWRTRGTLADYNPKHAMKEVQGAQTIEARQQFVVKLKEFYTNKNK